MNHTYSIVEVRQPPITIDELLATKAEFEETHPDIPSTLECSASIKRQLEKIAQPADKPLSHLGTLYGMDVVVDPDLKPGEWRFK